jgi:hypothetical protein
MKISKETALNTILEMQLTETLMFASDVFDAITHIRYCDMLQHLERLAEKSTLSEFEGED